MTRIAHINEAGCPWVLQQLSRYLDGELSSSVSDRVESHLESCASCQGAFEEELQLLTLTVDSLVSAEPPAGLEGQLLAALRAEPSVPTVVQPMTQPSRHLPTWLSAAAAVLLLVAGFALVTTEDTTKRVIESTGIVEIVEAEEVAEEMLFPQGDLDGDGAAGLDDVEILARHVSEGTKLPCETLADLDSDKSVTINDLVAAAHKQLYGLTEHESLLPSLGIEQLATNNFPCDELACL